jgi:uncharacterized membrane-anchored protein
MPLDDHPLRYALANELHARPFPLVDVPGRAVFVAIKPLTDAARRNRSRDWQHLLALLDTFGASHPPAGATHHVADLGRFRLKWESHTEFVTYTAFLPGPGARAFDDDALSILPARWLDTAPGVRLTSVNLRIEHLPEDSAALDARLGEWFVPESLACSRVHDGTALVASDFRIDSAGHVRVAAFVRPGTGPRVVGRLVQRLCEIETYKAMSMLGFARARELWPRIGELDTWLSRLVGDLTTEASPPDDVLKALLEVAAELESLLMRSSFRFGATAAYRALVDERIAALGESPLPGRQTLAEFMRRRFDPAMRTVEAAEARLRSLSDRSMRAGTLLSTRVDVDRSAQNQRLLENLDRRADLQLRLQRTVEGLSVVAISYYAVGLLANLALPAAATLGWDKTLLMAALTPPVVLAVWLTIRRIRRRIGH